MSVPYIIFPNFLNATVFYVALLKSGMAATDVKFACNEFEIAGIHGQIPELYWSENSRMTGNPHFYYDNFLDEVYIYLNTHVPAFFDFSNPLLTKEDTYDRFGNKILNDLKTTTNCTVICSSDAIQQHIKDKYPNFKTCWKFFMIDEVDSIIEKFKDNDYVLLPTSCGYDIEFLQSIPPLLRPRCIISVNDRCDASCPHFQRHLQESSQIAMMLTSSETSDFCPYYYGMHDEQGLSHKIPPLTYSYVVDELMPLKYSTFYISSIHDDLHYIKEICDFLVKEDRKMSILDLSSRVEKGVQY